MNKYLCYILFLSIFLKTETFGQPAIYMVKPATFSSRLYDEFSPVFYKGGIVFCSDQNGNSLVSYKDDQNRLFKIFYVTRRGTGGWSNSKLLAKELTTGFNDGPVTFNEEGNIIYYSRNNSVENSLRNISDTTNKLGIYTAELIDGIWTDIRPFTHNNPLYSFCTPALTPDGKRLYFSSDMPGGMGRMDLYYCDRRNNDWDKPVNLGPVINTPENESFPFAARNGKLYFASEGHNGFGGKDIFFTQEINGEWITPVHLDSAINSVADDFGIVTDSTSENGFFSTNRRNTDDIYSFSSAPVLFTNCDSIKENNYCFTFYDEKQRLIDTIPVIYHWDFGEGIILTGKEVKHCFPGPGKYSVKLTITDELTQDTLAKQVDYKVELKNIEQACINSYDVGLVDKSVSFEGIKNDLTGFSKADYLWDTGNGFAQGGPLMNAIFKKEGEYTIKLGLLGKEDSLEVIPRICVMKKIRIYNTFQEFLLKGETGKDEYEFQTDSVAEKSKTMQSRIYFMDDLSEKQKLKIRNALKGSGKFAVRFDKYGINSLSYPFLDIVAGLIKGNPDIRLELYLSAIEDNTDGGALKISEQWSRALSFYFKNKEIDTNALHSKWSDLSDPFFEPFVPESKTIAGVIEFVFMKY